MNRTVLAVLFFIFPSTAILPGRGEASLYSPQDSAFALPVGGDGKAHAFPLDRFEGLLATLNNALDERKVNGKLNDDRSRFLERIAKAERAKDPSAADAAALAGDLLRVGQLDRAIGILVPRTRDRRPNYFVFVTLSQIYATRGEWQEAIQYLRDGLTDAEMPATIEGLSPAQRDWWKFLDANYLLHYYQLRKREADARKGLSSAELEKVNEAEDVFPLFPLPDAKAGQSPVRFIGDGGSYQPGHIAAVESAKLPPDAIAVVQQLLLWFPGDTRLYWLLAELYAASNDLKAAATLFEKSSWSRQFGNRKVMMDHRVAVRSAVPKEPAAGEAIFTQSAAAEASATPPSQPAEQPPINMTTISWYFGAIGLVAAFAFIRGLLRRSKGNASPGG